MTFNEPPKIAIGAYVAERRFLAASRCQDPGSWQPWPCLMADKSAKKPHAGCQEALAAYLVAARKQPPGTQAPPRTTSLRKMHFLHFLIKPKKYNYTNGLEEKDIVSLEPIAFLFLPNLWLKLYSNKAKRIKTRVIEWDPFPISGASHVPKKFFPQECKSTPAMYH